MADDRDSDEFIVQASELLHCRTVLLRRLCMLFFIELSSRRVHLAGVTATPDGHWVAQRARELAWSLPERAEQPRFHDPRSRLEVQRRLR